LLFLFVSAAVAVPAGDIYKRAPETDIVQNEDTEFLSAIGKAAHKNIPADALDPENNPSSLWSSLAA